PIDRAYDINGLIAFDHHGHRWTRRDEQPERRIKRPVDVLGVVLIGQFAGHLTELHCHDRQSLGFKTADNGSGKTSAHRVWLDQHEGTLGCYGWRDVGHAITLVPTRRYPRPPVK